VSDIRWAVHEESALTLPDQEAIAAMLGQAFPDWSYWFVGGRSWSGMQPERRVVAVDADDVVVAHAGIRRQFVTVSGVDRLVAVVGLVAVTPRLQGRGVGRELLARTRAELDRLGVPFGILGTGEDRVPFYADSGWRLLDETVVTYTDFPAEGPGTPVTDDAGWLVLPVASSLEDWPRGPISWNGELV
jgi:nodulation protein A